MLQRLLRGPDPSLVRSVGVCIIFRVRVLSNKPKPVLDGLPQLLEVGLGGAYLGVAVGPEAVVVQMPPCQLHLLEFVLFFVQEET